MSKPFIFWAHMCENCFNGVLGTYFLGVRKQSTRMPICVRKKSGISFLRTHEPRIPKLAYVRWLAYARRQQYQVCVGKQITCVRKDKNTAPDLRWPMHMNNPSYTLSKNKIWQNVSTRGLNAFWKFHLPEKDCLPLAAMWSCVILWPCGGLLKTS